MLSCRKVSIIVTFFTKQSRDKNLNGLTVFDVHKLKMIFKGSGVNELKGENVLVNWELYDGDTVVHSNSTEAAITLVSGESLLWTGNGVSNSADVGNQNV